ncbi:hypothetical protein P4S73_06050 [Paraglaciecola sp. Hal342]
MNLAERLTVRRSKEKKFALLLSMLQQDILARPRIGPVNAEASWPEDEVTSYYPESHLQALAQDWLLADTTTEILHGDGIRNAQLWLAMHPSHCRCTMMRFISMMRYLKIVIPILKRDMQIVIQSTEVI